MTVSAAFAQSHTHSKDSQDKGTVLEIVGAIDIHIFKNEKKRNH